MKARPLSAVQLGLLLTVVFSFTALAPLGAAQEEDHGFLGVYFADVEESAAPVVEECVKGAPAAKAGWQPGDKITGLNGKPIASQGDLIKILKNTRPGDVVKLTVLRGTEKLKFKIILASKNEYLAKLEIPEVSIVEEEAHGEHAHEQRVLEVTPHVIIESGKERVICEEIELTPSEAKGGTFKITCKVEKGDEDFCDKTCEIVCEKVCTQTCEETCDAPCPKSGGKKAKAGKKAGIGVHLAQGRFTVIITEVVPDGPADLAGIHHGDQIVCVNGREVESPEKLAKLISSMRPGKPAVLKILREGRIIKRKVKTVPLDKLFEGLENVQVRQKLLHELPNRNQLQDVIIQRIHRFDEHDADDDCCGECGGASDEDCCGECEAEIDVEFHAGDHRMVKSWVEELDVLGGEGQMKVMILGEDCCGECDDVCEDDGCSSCGMECGVIDLPFGCDGEECDVWVEELDVPGGRGQIKIMILGDDEWDGHEDIAKKLESLLHGHASSGHLSQDVLQKLHMKLLKKGHQKPAKKKFRTSKKNKLHEMHNKVFMKKRGRCGCHDRSGSGRCAPNHCKAGRKPARCGSACSGFCHPRGHQRQGRMMWKRGAWHPAPCPGACHPQGPRGRMMRQRGPGRPAQRFEWREEVPCDGNRGKP